MSANKCRFGVSVIQYMPFKVTKALNTSREIENICGNQLHTTSHKRPADDFSNIAWDILSFCYVGCSQTALCCTPPTA